MVYCIGLFVGIILGLAAAVWTAGGWFGLLPGAQEGIQLPWDGKGWSLIAIYSAFVWLVYILPGWPASLAQSRIKLEKCQIQHAVWKHAAVWCGMFGPVAFLAGWYAELSWKMGLLICTVLAWGFYAEVWKVFSQLQYDPETLSMLAKVRHRMAPRGR
jgi:hypothetical protein